jgi:hypothetical protein
MIGRRAIGQRQCARIEDTRFRAEVSQQPFGFERQETTEGAFAQRAVQQEDAGRMRRPFARFETAQVGRGQQRVGEVRQIVHRVRATAAAGRAAFLAPRTYQGLRTVDDPDDRQHHRHFDQHADDRRQGRAGVEAEQAYRGGHGQFEEVAGSDQRRRTCDAMLFAGETVQQIGEAQLK